MKESEFMKYLSSIGRNAKRRPTAFLHAFADVPSLLFPAFSSFEGIGEDL
jgi:hypothetical protein